MANKPKSLLAKGICFVFCFSLLMMHSAFGQGGTWTWISGSKIPNDSGHYGIQGVPSINNYPPAMYTPCDWQDKQGNFWLYGGSGAYYKSDLWKFNPITREWTWMQGSGLSNKGPNYGTLGVPASTNTPGGRTFGSATWVDTSGNLWLFGGGSYNNLWKFDISSNMWTWMGGSMVINRMGVYGTQGIPSTLNTPGSRAETTSAWTDSLNNLWLFGGQGYDGLWNFGCLNDLWRYNISTGEWTWMKGSSTVYAPSNFGTKGIAATTNVPCGRMTYTKWKDKQGNFWIFGGAIDKGSWDIFGDMWKYDMGSNMWTWMSGSKSQNDTGYYNATCSFNAINAPHSRWEHRSSVVDNNGNFWMFAGETANTANFLNDLFTFDPVKSQWNWVWGNDSVNRVGNYGTLGVPSTSNIPPPRGGAIAWWGVDNKFYLFGGLFNDAFGQRYYADLWEYNPDPCSGSVTPPPSTNFQSNKVNICGNDCISFTDQSSNATSWQWVFPGGTPSSSTTQNPLVCYLTPGTYNATLITSNSAGSDTLTINNYITVQASPPTPTITQTGTTLYCSTDPSYISYQWYIGSNMIAGATDTSIIITKSGNYNVEVINANNCKIAVGINIILGLQNYMKDNSILLSPNPAKNQLTIYNAQFTIERIEIYNVLGQNVSASLDNRRSLSEVDVSALPPGIYFAQLIGENERWVGRFVKE